jgi:putative ABC transport system permease protein
MAFAGAGLAGGQALWRLWHMPVLAPAQPRAWAIASGRAMRWQVVGALALGALAFVLGVFGSGLFAGFALLAAALLAAALLTPAAIKVASVVYMG